MACLGPCPWGKEGEKVTCPKGRPDGVFLSPEFSYCCRLVVSQRSIMCAQRTAIGHLYFLIQV